MNQETKAFALKAAAQVAFVTAGAAVASAAVGCAGGAPGQASDELAGATSDCVRATDDEVAPPRDGDAGRAGPAADAGCDADATTTAVSCKEKLAASFPNGDPQWWSGGFEWLEDGGIVDRTVTDPELAACCEQMLFGAGPDGGSMDVENLGAVRESGCCSVTGWQKGASCSPWGPPTPPAMPFARGRRLAPAAGAVA